MNRYALISGNTVITVVEQNTTPTVAGLWVDVTAQPMVGTGHMYHGGDSFTEPASSLPRHITQLALMKRFTRIERDAIRAAEPNDGDVSDIMFLFNTARYIDLERQDTIDSVDAFEVKGLIGPGRALTVLSAPVEDIERP